MNNDNKHYIFFDINPEHKILIKDIFKRKNDKSNIILATNSVDIQKEEEFIKKYKIKAYESLSHLLEFDDRCVKDIFNCDFLEFFCLSKNADRNLSVFSYIAKKAKELNIAISKARVYLSPDWNDVEGYLKYVQDSLYKNIDVKLINTNRIASQILATKYQPIDYISINKETLLASTNYKITLIGHSLVALKSMFKMYHQSAIEGVNFELEILDKASDYSAKRFYELYSGFVKDVKLTNKSLENYEEVLGLESIKDSNLIIIDTSSDEDNYALARKIQDMLIEKGIIDTMIAVYLSNPSNVKDLDAYTPNIIDFGADEDIFTVDVIISEKFLRSAKLVNDKYNDLKEDSNKIKSWLSMTDFEKGSNVSVADFNANFIKIIGVDIFSKLKDNKAFQEYLDENPIKLENLSRTEHKRWNAYHFANSWDTLPVDDKLMEFSKDVKNKLHVCLVDYDDLDKPSEAFGEPYKEYDKDNVRLIYEIYKILN